MKDLEVNFQQKQQQQQKKQQQNIHHLPLSLPEKKISKKIINAKQLQTTKLQIQNLIQPLSLSPSVLSFSLSLSLLSLI